MALSTIVQFCLMCLGWNLIMTVNCTYANSFPSIDHFIAPIKT